MPMDEEIQSLYNVSDSVDLLFTASPILPDEVGYTVRGLGDSNKEEYPDEWKATGGVEGSFRFIITGRIIEPKQWSDYEVKLSVNSSGSMNRFGFESKGYLGDGWFSPKGNSELRICVRPQIVRDILDRMHFFYKCDKKPQAHYFHFELVDLKRGSGKGTLRIKDAIYFKIVSLSCR